MTEAEKKIVAIAAAALLAPHLKPEDFRESKPSPRTVSLIADAVRWATRIVQYTNAN